MRIARFLAAAGVDSRRHCEKLLRTRKITINGHIVTDPALTVDPEKDRVEMDQQTLRLPSSVYLLVNKPPGVTCSSQDRHADRLITELLPEDYGRLFTVGRLDRESEGLIICTNDGDFAHLISHPRYGLKKIYHVSVQNRVDRRTLQRLNQGTVSKKEKLQPVEVRYVKGGESKQLEFVLSEGKYREVRRLCAAANLQIEQLQRVAIGPLRDSQLKPGQWRQLSNTEISSLLKACGAASRFSNKST